jgi:hypothetical protein
MTGAPREMTVWQVVRELGRHPLRSFVRGWHWKAALTSSICRATVFFLVNVPVGLAPGLRAMLTELIFRGIVSGVLGALTQALCRARHAWTALFILPAIGHTAEFVVHWTAGTPRLSASLAASIAFSVLTTSFNLFAMSRGALVVGEGGQSLASDLRRLPALVAAFVVAGARIPSLAVRVWRKRKRKRARLTRRLPGRTVVSPL